jgi:hypothetical protein
MMNLILIRRDLKTMIDKINIIAFKKSQILEILDMLNLETKKLGRWVYVKLPNGELAKCFSCKKTLTTYSIGNIFKGNPVDMTCTNPCCFATFIVDKELISVSSMSESRAGVTKDLSSLSRSGIKDPSSNGDRVEGVDPSSLKNKKPVRSGWGVR